MPTISTNTSVWTSWCGTNSTSTFTTVIDPIWTTWSESTCTSTSGSTVWFTWVGETESSNRPRPHNSEEVNRWREEAAAHIKNSEKLRLEAEARAEKLLVENLSLQQRLQYEKEKMFVVNGKSGYRYRIRKGRVANVDMIDRSGKIEHRLCAHPSDAVPDYDTMLAQKLLLEDDEQRFIAVANKHSAAHLHTPVLPSLMH